MAIKGADRYIRVNTIALGAVRTDYMRNGEMVGSDEKMAEKLEKIANNMPFGIIETDDVWNMVKYILFEGTKITGQTFLMDSGVTCDDFSMNIDNYFPE
jgi:NAD(P)-dependent dehydrogenase (short-subunit alcohol dehydrogenase family)